MSKCRFCGNDMVWHGSMRDGGLECPVCVTVDPIMFPDTEYIELKPVPDKGVFKMMDPINGIVKCPHCDYVEALCQMAQSVSSPAAQCPDCGYWSQLP